MVPCMKNPHYKSAVETYNTATQALTITPAPLGLTGTVLTNTGISLSPEQAAVKINNAGLYQARANVQALATAAGDIVIGLYLDGVLLPETRRTVTAAADAAVSITTDMLRSIPCDCNSHTLQLYGWVVGAAAANVTFAQLAVVKEAGRA